MKCERASMEVNSTLTSYLRGSAVNRKTNQQ